VPEEIRLWQVKGADELHEVTRCRLDLESRLEQWIERDVSVLDPGLLVIGRQVETDFGGFIDLLCVDQGGNLAVVELKRDRSPREITAQVLDYAAWVKDLSNEQVTAIAEAHLGQGQFEEAFRRKFGIDLPDTLNEDHRPLIVASSVDASSERIIEYLSGTHGVNINAATFQYFREADGPEFLARVFVLDPEGVDRRALAKGASKRRPNLTYDDLAAIAAEKGVRGLYDRAVSGLERSLQKHTTRSSIGFTANLEGSRKTVVSLLPPESGRDGLRFQVYFLRLRTLLGVSEEDGLALLPRNRQAWVHYEGAGPDYEGFQGFFATESEIDRFVAGVNRLTAQQSADRG
jgi:hypothetical protein